MPHSPIDFNKFSSLVQIVAKLRGPNGCPWDKQQTNKSLTRYIIEEAYELVEAINCDDIDNIKEELGDNLFQVVLQSQIFNENNKFDLDDVIDTISEKMIRRHPHVFSNQKVNSVDDVLTNWDSIKEKEKKSSSQNSPLKKYEELPAWLNSFKMGEQCKKHNFDWQNSLDVLSKVKEEILELEQALLKNDKTNQEEELGDIFFSLVQLSRHLNLDLEMTLRKANNKFYHRFKIMYDKSIENNRDFKSLSLEEKEDLWSYAKQQEKC